MKTETKAAATAAPTPAVVTPVGPPPPPKHIVHDGKVWEYLDRGGFRGYVPSTMSFPTGKPDMLWTGGRITMGLWQQVLAFFEWSQTTFKSEVQVRLYYNTEARKWGVWAYPQEPNGMTTKELPDHADTAVQRLQFKPPWMLLGTVHHHCTSSAFQSGVDKDNETSQEGLHITVGGIGSAEYSIHGRILVRQQSYGGSDGKIPWETWFELPEAVHALPEKLQLKVLDFYLKDPPPPETPFPEAWKTNCHPPSSRQTWSAKEGAWDRATGGTGPTMTGPTPRTYIITTDLRSQFSEQQIDFMKEALRMMKEAKLSHNEADTLVAAEDAQLSASDRVWVGTMFECGKKFNLDEPAVDKLFDQWDFATVLEALGPPTTAGNTTQQLSLASTK